MNGDEAILHCPACGEVMLLAQGYWECPRCGGEFWTPEEEATIDSQIRECFFEETHRGVRKGSSKSGRRRRYQPPEKRPATRWTEI